MKHNAKLYIANKEVDCNEKISLPITYSLEDLNNPTVVKNSFSKTISIPATKNNNKIFGEIYKLDRMQHYEQWTGNPQLNGINFDPSKRVDFAIYVNGEIVESGYCQLNDISVEGEIKAYNITLYGGLGDFFYNLKYGEDGSQKTLADIQYFIEDEDGNVLDKDKEMNFTINKDIVDECYSKTWEEDGNQLTDTITFIPAYNGSYDNFDSSHCIVNTEGQSIFSKTYSVKEDTGTVVYSTYNGYGLASLNQDYNEWEMKDLRSYQQRPAIKVSKLIEAICREENSGYKVTFDKRFFNKKNPYWDKSFIALPLLGTTSEDAETKGSGTVSFNTEHPFLGYRTNQLRYLTANTAINVNGEGVTSENGIIDMSSYPVASTFNLDVDFSLAAYSLSEVDYDNFYIAAKYGYAVGRNYYYRYYPQAITAQAIAYDATTNAILGYSDQYYFTNLLAGRGNTANSSQPDTWIDYTPRTSATNTPVYGKFEKLEGRKYYFKSENGNDTFRLSLSKIPRVDNVKVVVYFDWRRSNENCQYRMWPNMAIVDSSIEGGYPVGEEVEGITQDSFEISYSNPILSGASITKDMILKTESSPADFLLSFSKMFGLYYVKDVNSKEITIYNRQSYFQPVVNNWESRIDHSKNITINPILFDKKWYLMSLETPETYFADKYKEKFDLSYGQKRLSTGYNFNSDTQSLFEDNKFQTTIPAIDSDRYYRTFHNGSGAFVPCFINDNATYTLYKDSESYDIEMYGVKLINPGRTVEWSSLGKDIFPKQCFFSMSGSSKDLQEISASLVFYNGTVDCKDSRGNDVDFWITDDIMEMSALNDGEMCYLYTVSETDENGNQIAIKRNSLPQYISYYTKEDDSVSDSFDFGLPKEIYTNHKYSEEATLYNKFWMQFFDDQFSINTKKVTCYVKLDDLKVNSDLLREFYYFDNSYWILNKIDSYDVNSTATVRCEFIKVQDIANYRATVEYGSLSVKGIKTQTGTDVFEFPKNSSTYTYFMDFNSSSTVEATINYGQILQVTDTQVIFYVNNNQGVDRDVVITLTNQEGVEITVNVPQEGTPPPTLSVDPDTVTLDDAGNGTSGEFSISSNADWHIIWN